jgi:hypothetical protein
VRDSGDSSRASRRCPQLPYLMLPRRRVGASKESETACAGRGAARGTTMNAASSGPMADPVLPPTWNSDWADPCCPPEAMRATRDESGGNTDEPTPTSAAANKIVGFRGL